MYEAPAESVYWNMRAATGYAPNWFSFCARILNKRITGSEERSPTDWALSRFGVADHLLEIGCLRGDKAVGLLRAAHALRVSGVDLAAEAIDMGRVTHGPLIELTVMDLNDPTLPEAAYDIILANGVLHHIANLEACVEALYAALTPGGWLIASEFTGPRRYLYSAKEVRLINEGVAMLPVELQAPFSPNSLANKLRKDPSESVRSRDIEPILRATFDAVEAYPYGGNVLQRALSPTFFAGYASENPEHAGAVERLIAFDTSVYAREPSHHCFFIARKT